MLGSLNLKCKNVLLKFRHIQSLSRRLNDNTTNVNMPAQSQSSSLHPNFSQYSKRDSVDCLFVCLRNQQLVTSFMIYHPASPFPSSRHLVPWTWEVRPRKSPSYRTHRATSQTSISPIFASTDTNSTSIRTAFCATERTKHADGLRQT